MSCNENLFKYMKLQSEQQLSGFTPNTLKILSITWNLVGSIPPEQQLVKFFSSSQFNSGPDVIFIGTQQCEVSLFWAFFWDSKPLWQATLKKYLNNKYHLLQTHQLQGLHTAILILHQHKDNSYIISKNLLKAGFCCGLFGNKGAISIKIKIYGKYFQFINCHLAPHQDNADKRNETLLKILHSLACKFSSTEVILLGDMNYRLEISNEDYKKFLKKHEQNTEENVHYKEMFKIQQLTSQQELKESFFPLFQQGKIEFPPTYKLSLTNKKYSRNRVPGWTDRIFSRKGKLRNTSYNCLYDIYGSDHRAVIANFQLDVEEGLSLFEEQRVEDYKCQII